MEKTGIAIIGASNRCKVLFAYFKMRPDAGYVAGVYDLVASRSRFFLDHFDVSDGVVYESLDQAVCDPRVAAVFIGTPDNEHVEPVLAALKAGKHVYCEKPMAIALRDCDTIIAAARNAGTVFYLGMNMRHSPIHETLHELVTANRLGKVLTIEANEYYEGGRTYFKRWNRLRGHSGGLWVTKACHDFDLLNWFAGGKPTRVYATSSLSFYRPKPEGGTHCRVCPIKKECPDFYDIEKPDDSVKDAYAALAEEATGLPRDLCLYNSDKDTFDNGSAVVEYDNDIRATYTVNVVAARTTRQMRIIGTLGSAEGDMETGVVTFWKRYSEEKETIDLRKRMDSGHGGSDDRILDDFFRCCRSGDRPRSSWADGRLSLQVALAARESCDSGSVVEILQEEDM